MPLGKIPDAELQATVTVGDGWRAFEPAALPGWDFLGVIQYDGVTGALAQSWATGSFAVMRDQTVTLLPAEPVNAALLTADVWRLNPTPP